MATLPPVNVAGAQRSTSEQVRTGREAFSKTLRVICSLRFLGLWNTKMQNAHAGVQLTPVIQQYLQARIHIKRFGCRLKYDGCCQKKSLYDGL